MGFGRNLTLQECKEIHEAMNKVQELTKFIKIANLPRVIDFLLKDRVLLRTYLTKIAAEMTRERQQVTNGAIIFFIFRDSKGVSKRYDREFLSILKDVVVEEKKRQYRIFVPENYLQTNINSDIWKMYEWYGGVLRGEIINFTKINRSSLRFEVKCYLRFMFERNGKITQRLFEDICRALNILTKINPSIRYFSDITEADARALVMHFEANERKSDGSKFSQYSIGKSVNSIKRVINYLMNDVRASDIKTPYPHRNPFTRIIFRNLRYYNTPTAIIPEEVIEQINNHKEDFTPTNRLIYEIFLNTGLRTKEVYFLEDDCIEPSNYENICLLKYKPHKVLAHIKRHGLSDYRKIMIPQNLADKISDYIEATQQRRVKSGYRYIFLSKVNGYETAVEDSQVFIRNIRSIIKKHNICDENGCLWHFTSRQFRKTIVVRLIENGATVVEVAYWLGHMCSDTAEKYYIEVRKRKLAEFNTKFFQEKFGILISNEQLESFSEEERKLLYVDFRLEQRRVELGFCLEKTANCTSRNSLYNCVNCHNLCTGRKYLSYWMELLEQQQIIVNKLIKCYNKNKIKDFEDYMEYKQEIHLLKGYENIVNAIKGDLYE